MIVLPNRRCGKVKGGGLYGVSQSSPLGTLKAWTWLVAPLMGDTANPRTQEIIDVQTTLEGWGGLVYPSNRRTDSFAGLPDYGIADHWGTSFYKTPWDVAEEVARLGVCRRVSEGVLKRAQEFPLPLPVFAIHGRAGVDFDPEGAQAWLEESGIEWGGLVDHEGGLYDVFSQPWKFADSLGRVGDDDYSWHPHALLYQVMRELLDKRLFTAFEQEESLLFEAAVFGLSWITSWVWVVPQGEDEDDMPNELQDMGVLPAYGVDDPRAQKHDTKGNGGVKDES